MEIPMQYLISINICFVITFIIFVPIKAEENIYPVGVVRSSEAYPSSENTYSAEKAFDNNPETYCCLLDTSRNGIHGNQTIPPNGAVPVEGELVVDLSKIVTVSDLIMKSRNNAGAYLPKRHRKSS
jgi:hypothetical protein